MAEVVTKFVKFDGGKRARPYLITQIDIDEKGVFFCNGEGKTLGRINCPVDHRERVADLFAEALSVKEYVAPDLAFLQGKAGK